MSKHSIIRTTLSTGLAGIIALTAAPAFAADPAAATTAAAAATAAIPGAAPSTVDAEDRKYCVRDTLTGTRVPQKICRTRADWKRYDFDPLAPRK